MLFPSYKAQYPDAFVIDWPISITHCDDPVLKRPNPATHALQRFATVRPQPIVPGMFHASSCDQDEMALGNVKVLRWW